MDGVDGHHPVTKGSPGKAAALKSADSAAHSGHGSRSKGYDRGSKFEHYRRLDTLEEYLLVAQDRPHLEYYRRQPEGSWLLSEVSGLEAGIALLAIDSQLALAEVYDKVPLETEGPGHPPHVG